MAEINKKNTSFKVTLSSAERNRDNTRNDNNDLQRDLHKSASQAPSTMLGSQLKRSATESENFDDSSKINRTNQTFGGDDDGSSKKSKKKKQSKRELNY